MTESAAARSPTGRDIWRDWRSYAVVALVFTMFALVNGAQAYVSNHVRGDGTLVWWLAVLNGVPFWLSSLILLPPIVWAARRSPLQRRGWQRAVGFHLGFSVVHSAVRLLLAATIGFHLFNWLGDDPKFSSLLSGVFAASFAGAVTLYWSLVGAVLAVDYYTSARERERQVAQADIRAARLKANLERARLDWLRSQLNPHFLFNTLNSVSTLAQQRRTEEVVKTLADLGDLLRATLRHSAAMVPLDEEMELLDKYLDIERLRFGDRLTIEVDIEPAAGAASIPSLLLQPIVENALKHGLGGVRGPVGIWISGRLREGRLELEVVDSGRGFRTGWSEGVGLSNTRARLRQIYGDDATVTIAPRERGASVRLRLPLVEESGEAPAEAMDGPRGSGTFGSGEPGHEELERREGTLAPATATTDNGEGR